MKIKKGYILACYVLFFLGIAGVGNAALITIGTATVGGSNNYNLIWDDDNNGNSVVWLDYSQDTYTDWTTQAAWAANLASTLNLAAGYSINWTDNAWRLPATSDGIVNGPGSPQSELGHLYYTELGNVYDSISPFNPNLGDFENLQPQNYWSGTAWQPGTHYYFSMAAGTQAPQADSVAVAGGLAIRSGEVVYNPIPEPGTLWLVGSCLIGIVGIRKRRRARTQS